MRVVSRYTKNKQNEQTTNHELNVPFLDPALVSYSKYIDFSDGRDGADPRMLVRHPGSQSTAFRRRDGQVTFAPVQVVTPFFVFACFFYPGLLPNQRILYRFVTNVTFVLFP